MASWFLQELQVQLTDLPFRFTTRQPGMLMKTLKPGERYMTILVNKSTEQRHVELIAKASLRPTIVFADQHGKIAGNTLTIASEETLVILWTPTIAGLRTRIQEPPPKEM